MSHLKIFPFRYSEIWKHVRGNFPKLSAPFLSPLFYFLFQQNWSEELENRHQVILGPSPKVNNIFGLLHKDNNQTTRTTI